MWYLESSFQLGGGYLFGLPVGFVADSIGATIGAGAAFLLGRTVSLWILMMLYASQIHNFALLDWYTCWQRKLYLLVL